MLGLVGDCEDIFQVLSTGISELFALARHEMVPYDSEINLLSSLDRVQRQP